jgi:hypothetical protein
MAAAIAAGEQMILTAKRHWPDRAFDRIGIEFDAAIAQEARQPLPARERVADRFGERAAAGYEGKLGSEPAMQRLHNWLGEGPSLSKPMGRRLSTHTCFDGIELADPAQRLSRYGRTGRLGDFVKFASCVTPTGGENNVFVAGELLEAGIAIDMQDAFEAREMRCRTLGLAVRRKQIDRPAGGSGPPHDRCSRA